MKTASILVTLAVTLAPLTARAADEAQPAIRDLAFLIGTWKVEAAHLDPGHPEAPPRREAGTKTCRFALEIGGEPSYIVCENQSVYTAAGGEQSNEPYVEWVNYNPHVDAFEKTNFFAGFPLKVIERVTFDPKARVVEIRGRVGVGHAVDSYVETWRFEPGFSAFAREASINLSSMPMTEFRPIVSGRNVRAAQPE